MKSRLKQIFLLFILAIVSFGTGLWVSAQEHSQNLVIIKYGLSEGATGFKESQTVNTGQMINNIPVDNLNHELVPVADIHYLVQEISPSGEKIGKEMDIVTNKLGVAPISLTDGTYLVSEQVNLAAGLKKAAAPVVIDLPTFDQLSTVYIYPKSSVVMASPPSSSSSSAPKYGEKITDTKGSFGRFGEESINIGLALGIIVVSLLLLVFKRREDKEQDDDSQAIK